MKPDNHVNTTMKIVNVMIITMVVGGAVVFAVINQAAESEVMTTLFLAFLGAIITIQIIPCLVLLGSILKGIINLVRKQSPSEVVNHTKSLD